MSIDCSPLHSALLVRPQPSYGVSKASFKQLLLLDSRLYLQAPNNISTLMAGKTDEISLECSRQVTGLSNGSSTTLELIQGLHIALLEGRSLVKKSLLLSIQVIVRPLSTQELL
jgi:hypothetical protein